MFVVSRVLVPSALADAIDDQYRIDDEETEALRSGDKEAIARLSAESERANAKRRELTP
jgi:hypothetical protein